MEKNELACVQRAVQGDREALEALLSSVQDGIFNLSLRMLGMVADAEDATQEILIRVMTGLSGFRGDSAFSTWVYRVAVNYLLDCKKSMFAQHPLSFEEYGADIEAGFAAAGELGGVDEGVLADELKMSCSNVMLQCLDPASRCIYILGTMFHADSRVAAELLDMTPENYRQKLSRVRRRMGDFLRTYCGLSGGKCDCRKRIGHAMRTHRLDPARLEYHALEARTEPVLAACTQEMTDMEARAEVFAAMPQYRAPHNARTFLQELLSSAGMERIRGMEKGGN